MLLHKRCAFKADMPVQVVPMKFDRKPTPKMFAGRHSPNMFVHALKLSCLKELENNKNS